MIKLVLKFLLAVYNAIMVVALVFIMIFNRVMMKNRWTKVPVSSNANRDEFDKADSKIADFQGSA